MIAIADFHAPASMVWSHTALSLYLYGVGVEVRTREDGSIFGVEKPLGDHVVGKKVVPTNFFAQLENRNVSVVQFSNAGTLTKFNRMGVRTGFGNPGVTLTRRGIFNDPTPGAFKGIPFELNVEDPDYSESWADEIEIYHNPNAAADQAFKGCDCINGPGLRHFHSSNNARAINVKRYAIANQKRHAQRDRDCFAAHRGAGFLILPRAKLRVGQSLSIILGRRLFAAGQP